MSVKKFLSYFFLGGIMPALAAPYGTFTSPISAELVAKGSLMIRQILVENDELYWLESRPEEKGRITAIKHAENKEILPASYYIRTTVHEYGGKCCALHEGTLYFSNFTDQNIYSLSPNKPMPN